ncbi:MAG: peptide-methionine (S)-S-oxide reductase [Burkholderiaceae bacterium]
MHDPTTLNCQGNDTGTQYRSGIYYNAPAANGAGPDRRAHPRQRLRQPDRGPSWSRWPTLAEEYHTRTSSSATRTRATAWPWPRPRWRSFARRLRGWRSRGLWSSP